MRKIGLLFLLSYFSIHLQATQIDSVATPSSSSSVGSIVIGVIILLAIIIVLYRRQKRKFND